MQGIKIVNNKEVDVNLPHTPEVLLEEGIDDIAEIYNNLIYDLEMDKKGEKGYSTHKKVVEAIKKYTLKVINEKHEKWVNALREHNNSQFK